MATKDMPPTPKSAVFPNHPKHRFFDSSGPGGVVAPLPGVPNDSLPVRRGQDLRFKRQSYLPFAHKSYIYCMLLVNRLYQHDGTEEMLITGGGDGVIKVWSIDGLGSGGLMERVKLKNDGCGILSMVYNGTCLSVGLSNGHAHIWNLDSRQLIQKVDMNCKDIGAIQLVHGTTYCGTGLGRIKVW